MFLKLSDNFKAIMDYFTTILFVMHERIEGSTAIKKFKWKVILT
jgi:hypothetical protein